MRTVNLTDLDSLSLQYPHQQSQQQAQHQAAQQQSHQSAHQQTHHQQVHQQEHQQAQQQAQHQANDLNDFRAINLPLSDCNIQLIDSHLLSNLSIHDGDSNDRKDDDQNVSMSSANIPPELPVLTFSGMLTSSDLDGPDGFGRSTAS